MASLKDAASLINELSQETQLELYKSWQHNQEAAVSRLVEIAKEKGQTGYDAATVKRLIEEFIAEVQKMIAIGAENNVSFTVEEVKTYLRELDEEDEFDDVELNEAALAAVSGGARGTGSS